MIENNAPTKILKHINVQVFHRDFLFLIFNKDGPGQDADLQVQIDTFFDKYIFVVFPVVAHTSNYNFYQKGSEDISDELKLVSNDHLCFYVCILCLSRC